MRRWTGRGSASSVHGWTTLLRTQLTPSKPLSGQGVVVLVVEEVVVVVVVVQPAIAVPRQAPLPSQLSL